MDKNAECGYYLVKWTSGIYTFHYYHKTGKDFIKVGNLVFDALYLNPISNIKKCYTPCEN